MRMRNWLLALMLLFCPAIAEASCPSTITDCPSPTFNVVTAASIISSGGSFANPTITGTVTGGATYAGISLSGTTTGPDGGTWSPSGATFTVIAHATLYAAAYGALCNDSHDDTSAIQAAATAAAVVNAEVVLPYGRCIVSSTINLVDGNAAIRGVGSQTQGQTFPTLWAGTTIFDTRLGGDTFAFVGKNGPIFRDFAIWESTTKTSGAGISVNGYNTTLTANAVAGASSLAVVSSTGFVNGDPVIVLHNDGTRYTGTVNGTPTPTSIPITPSFSGATANSGNAVADMPAQFPRFYNLQLVGLYDGIRLDSATGEYLSANYIRDFAHDGLKKVNAAWPDSGNAWYGGNLFIDQAVSGNAGVEWLAGGDAAFVGNKFFKGAYNFLLNISYNSTASLRLEANSFEEASTCGVQATQASSGIIYNAFKVDENEFSLSGSGTGKIFCVAAGSAASWITKISFQNNVAATDDSTVGRNMIDILGGTQVKIASNQLDNGGAANATAINVASGVLNTEVFMNKIVNYATKYSVGEVTASFIDSAGLASNGTGAAVAENQADMNEALANKVAGTSFYIDNHSGDAMRFYDGNTQFGLNQDGSTHGLQINIPGTGTFIRFLPSFNISMLAPVTFPDSGTWTSSGISNTSLLGTIHATTATNDGTTTLIRQRSPLSGGAQTYVATSGNGGSNSNDCLAATVTGGHGPCADMQHVYNLLVSSYDFNTGAPTINIGAGSFDMVLNATGVPVGFASGGGGQGDGALIIISGAGSGSTTINPVSNCGTYGHTFTVSAGMAIELTGLFAENHCSGGGSYAVGFAQNFGQIQINSGVIIGTSNWAGLHAEHAGLIEVSQSMTFNGGNPSGAINVIANGMFEVDPAGITLTFSGSYSTCVIYDGPSGEIDLNGQTITNTATGVRAWIQGGRLSTGVYGSFPSATYLPGNGAIIQSGKGEYIQEPTATIQAATGLGSGSAAVIGLSNSTSGRVVLSPSGAPGNNGQVQVSTSIFHEFTNSAATPPGLPQAQCMAVLAQSGTDAAWNGGAGLNTFTSGSGVNTIISINWTNNAVALTVGSTYSISYYCP